jgi:hypothetical protein
MKVSNLLMFFMVYPLLAHGDLDYSGYLQGSATTTSTNEDNWLQGGVGAQGTGEGADVEGRFGINTRFELLTTRISVLARKDPNGSAGSKAGLLEAFVDYGSLNTQGYRLRSGLGFASTSRENVEEFWQTPYTLTLSALNTWIGEEFRPIGLDFTKRQHFTPRHTLDWSIGSYVGNDTGPAILAWRGYALHNRLSVYGETLPLPKLISLDRTDQFSKQRNDGTQPFGPDLDKRPGYSVRLRYEILDGPLFSAFYTDNRGDRKLHDGDEYAWQTRFSVVGVDWAFNPHWRLLSEAQSGSTNMGFPPGANVQTDFTARYLLLSYSYSNWILSARVETFEVKERDFSPAELNDQEGSATTLAVLYRMGGWRLGAELQHAAISRPGNPLDISPVNNISTQQGGNQFTLIARRYF